MKYSIAFALLATSILTTSCGNKPEPEPEVVEPVTYQLSGTIKTHGQLLDRICIDTNQNLSCDSDDLAGEFLNDEYWFDVPEDLSDGTLIITELSNEITGSDSIMATTLFEGELITPVTTLTALSSISNPSITNKTARYSISARTGLNPNSAALIESQYQNSDLSLINNRIEKTLVTVSACLSLAQKSADARSFNSVIERNLFWTETGKQILKGFDDVFDWASEQTDITSENFASYTNFTDDEDSDNPCFFDDSLVDLENLADYTAYSQLSDSYSRVDMEQVIQTTALHLGLEDEDLYSLVVESNGDFEINFSPYQVIDNPEDVWSSSSAAKASEGNKWVVEDDRLKKFNYTSEKLELSVINKDTVNFLTKYYAEEGQEIETSQERSHSVVEIDVSNQVMGNVTQFFQAMSETSTSFLSSGRKFPAGSKAYLVNEYNSDIRYNPYYVEPVIIETGHTNNGQTVSETFSTIEQLLNDNPIISNFSPDYAIQLINVDEQRATILSGSFNSGYSGSEEIVCEVDWIKPTDYRLEFNETDLENCNLPFSSLYLADDGKFYFDDIEYEANTPLTIVYLNSVAMDAYLQEE